VAAVAEDLLVYEVPSRGRNVFLVQFIQCFLIAVQVDAMYEPGIGMLVDQWIDMFPESLVIADRFAVRADRNNA